MSSALSIVTSLSDFVNNPKFDRYDPDVCKSIHVKLDQETKDKGLSYDERFDAVKSIEIIDKSHSILRFFCLSRQEKICQSTINGQLSFPTVLLNV